MQKDEGVGFRFDPVVAQDVVRLYDALELDRLRALFYRWGMSVLVDREFMGVAYYQWVGLGLLILIAVLIDLLVQRLLLIAGTRYLDGESGELDKPTARNATLKVAKPVALAVAAAVFYFALPILSLPAGGESILRIAARFLGFAAFIWGAYRVIDLVAAVFRERTARTASTFDDLLVPLLTRAVKIFVIAFGVVLIAESLQLPITSLVAGLGIGGLAFAFAAKDTIENLFGSIAVILDRPFNVGDFVKVEGIEGIIESMGFRSTRIRTFHNSLVTLPNAMLVRATVDNFGARAYRRYKTHINLIYSTPPDKLEAFCEGIRDLVRKHPATRKDVYEIYVNELGPHSIDVLVYIFFVAPTWSIELRERHRFILDVIRLAKRLEVEFAFPTQTLVLERPGPAQPFAVRRPEPDSRDVGREAASEVLEGSEWRD
jgi:MscS family membrane protein